jgi:hypothetical protein
LREPDADASLYSRRATHLENEAIDYGAYSDSDNRWYPTEQSQDRLFEKVTRGIGSLSPKILEA